MKERSYQGTPASPGIAIGPAFVIDEGPSEWKEESKGSVQEELQRLKQALLRAEREIEELHEEARGRLGEKDAAIFEAHKMFLSDPDLIERAEQLIRQGSSAVESWNNVVNEYVSQLEALEDPVFQARAVDLRDVGDRVLRIMLGKERKVPVPQSPSIIVAAELSPSQTILIPREMVLGFCTVLGTTTSHVAILSRGLGIPAVVGLPPEFLAGVNQGDELVVDGNEGVVIVSPEESTTERYKREMEKWSRSREALLSLSDLEAVSVDGRRIEVGANLGGGGDEEIKLALDRGAEGIGLLRTEFLYMERERPPSEEEQITEYRRYLDGMSGRSVIFRTVDIGGDKAIPYLRLPREPNPFLGKRGIRLSLAEKELFRTQLRAILRAGAGHRGVKIMFPMVSGVDEVRAARELLDSVRNELREEKAQFAEEIEVGVMIEVPSAAVMADVIANEVDFFSIGTNDLSQYTLAADRTHPEVGKMADALEPAVLRLIKMVSDAAHEAGIWVGICGELAGDALAAPVLLGLGIDELSMAPNSIPEVKARIRQWNYEDAKALAEEVLNLESAEAVRRFLTEKASSFAESNG